MRIIQDPTLTIGPGIVRSIVGQFLDGFSGAQITVEILTSSLQRAGVAPGPTVIPAAANDYAAWAQAHGTGSAWTADCIRGC